MSFERTIQMENHIILPVFGQFDANIKKIEKACGVSIVNRGDDVRFRARKRMSIRLGIFSIPLLLW